MSAFIACTSHFTHNWHVMICWHWRYVYACLLCTMLVNLTIYLSFSFVFRSCRKLAANEGAQLLLMCAVSKQE